VSLYKALQTAAQERGDSSSKSSSAPATLFGVRGGLSKTADRSASRVPGATTLTKVIEDRTTLSERIKERTVEATYDAATDTIDLRDGQIDLADGAEAAVSETTRVTVPCERCGADAQRDLFDRFSKMSYFSCSSCGLMWQQVLSS